MRLNPAPIKKRVSVSDLRAKLFSTSPNFSNQGVPEKRKVLINIAPIKKNINQPYKIDIYKYTETEARRFIHLRNKQNPFEEESESYYDTNDVNNILVNDINEEGTETSNFMKNKIGIDFNSVKLQCLYCTFETLSKAIRDNFKLDKKSVINTRQAEEYLIDFFNELISIYKEEFEDIKSNRKVSFVTYNNAFYGFIAIASKLYKVDHWQDKLASIKTVNFHKNNKGWKSLGMTSKNISNKQINAIYKIFKDFIKIEEEVAIDGK